MTIYGISGLGADERVFQSLTLSQKIQPVHWIPPKAGETIESYASRLTEQIKDDNFILIGVSFGGLVAVEIGKIKKPRLTILVSSAETADDLKLAYKIIGRSGIIKFIPSFLFNPSKPLMYWLFGAKNKKLLKDILNDTDLEFSKWAIIKLTQWSNQEKVQNLVKIHGTKDKLISYRKSVETVQVKDGQHFMIVDKAKEISLIIEEKIKNAG
jgi:pimeloyl-ACP methyl ester carboxylesterase